ncbi:MAG TPA: catechol 1,2-dioxygenase [Phenylobacterium sp.]|uniref:catechol 1,2-dioxygenase n=1 Tax=Phenylobacterium sp. TaxID=1871053 RepID=UPI002B4886BC|nr:catechol 1,2-dioxygenase [Phenylobacterium sp.]HKR88244.1 catechol 1,2-dioxygenase [Phenylobacterium sp.]
MTAITESSEVQALLDKASGLDAAGGDQRTKQIVRKILADLFETIDRFDVSEDEFWHALNFLAAGAPEFGLWAPGLGVERFLDIRADEKARAAGEAQGTPRTIEGPLYVGGAPLVESGSRIDDGSDVGEVLVMHGQVRDLAGRPVAGAVVDVWHANTKGNYSYFDKTQSDYNMRRRIKAGDDGRYEFRSIVPSGYAVPPGGSTDQLLQAVGRHGKRPAHIHFFVSAPGHKHLTTQINIDGDPYLRDDFAYATREELIPPVARRTEPDAIHARGLNAPFSEIEFDFTLAPAAKQADEALSTRPRALVA